jgi:hypothetical protein
MNELEVEWCFELGLPVTTGVEEVIFHFVEDEECRKDQSCYGCCNESFDDLCANQWECFR